MVEPGGRQDPSVTSLVTQDAHREHRDRRSYGNYAHDKVRRRWGVFGRVVTDSEFPRMTQLATSVRKLRGLGTDVLYVDKQLVVLNKRSGVVAQPTRSIDRDSENQRCEFSAFHRV